MLVVPAQLEQSILAAGKVSANLLQVLPIAQQQAGPIQLRIRHPIGQGAAAATLAQRGAQGMVSQAFIPALSAAASRQHKATARKRRIQLFVDERIGPVFKGVVVTAVFQHPCQLAAKLERLLDGRKVDVRLIDASQEAQPIDRIAMQEGVLLC